MVCLDCPVFRVRLARPDRHPPSICCNLDRPVETACPVSLVRRATAASPAFPAIAAPLDFLAFLA